LLSFFNRFGIQFVVNGLGYLLELYDLGTKIAIEMLHQMFGPSYALLDPQLPAQGNYLARWRLRLNIDPEVLKGIVTT